MVSPQLDLIGHFWEWEEEGGQMLLKLHHFDLD